MHVLRLLRIFIPLLLLAAVVAGIVLVVTSRSDLQRSRKQVDTAWTTQLGPALDARYRALSAANAAVGSVPGPLHELVTQVAAEYTHWGDLVGHNGSVTAEVNAANDLESLGRRLVLAARRAPRLVGKPNALDKVNAYASLPPPPAASGFNAAVSRFERSRNQPARRLAARILGYGSIPAYVAAGSG